MEEDQKGLSMELSEYEENIQELNKEMAMLKAHLYGKFGNTINLETE
jgi:chaperonin cofactor prefoldin